MTLKELGWNDDLETASAARDEPFVVRKTNSSGTCLDDPCDEIAWLDRLRFEATSD